MKKTITTILALTLTMSLTACSSAENIPDDKDIQNSSQSGISKPTSESSQNSKDGSHSSPTSSTFSENSSSSASESLLSEDDFPESFIGYVGETLRGADAAEKSDNTVKFDNFTYLRYAAPIFDNTLKTPDLIDQDTLEMPKYDDMISQKQTDPKWFAVRAGDVLENGLVVKSVSCGFKKMKYFDGTEEVIQTQSEVVFENALTVTGVLYCNPEQDMYIGDGELFFFPDTTANLNIPVISRRDRAGEYSIKKYIFTNNAFVCDGIYYRVGDIESASVDLGGIIKRGEASEVRVTFDNIKLVENETGSVLSGAYADIVSVEKVGN